MTDFFDGPVSDAAQETTYGDFGGHLYGHTEADDGALYRHAEPLEPDNLLYDSDGDGDIDTVFVDSDRDGDIDMIRHLPQTPDAVEVDDVPSHGAFGYPEDNLGHAVDTDGDGEMDKAVIAHGNHETTYEDVDHDGVVDQVSGRNLPSGNVADRYDRRI